MALGSNEGDKTPLSELKNRNYTSKGELEKFIQASEDKVSEAEHCNQEPELKKEIAQDLEITVNRGDKILMRSEKHVHSYDDRLSEQCNMPLKKVSEVIGYRE